MNDHHQELHDMGKESFSARYNLDVNEAIIKLLERFVAEKVRW